LKLDHVALSIGIFPLAVRQDQVHNNLMMFNYAG